MEEHKSDELDRLLDAGLATYAGAEPWPGMDERILDRVHRAPARKPRLWWWAAVAVPVAACLVVFGVLSKPGKTPTPATPQIAEVEPIAPELVRAPETPRRVVNKARVRHAAELPKRAQFPTVAPLTREERVLADLVAKAPQEARALLIEAAPLAARPIEIAPIQIAPLEGGNSYEDDKI